MPFLPAEHGIEDTGKTGHGPGHRGQESRYEGPYAGTSYSSHAGPLLDDMRREEGRRQPDSASL